MRKTEFCLCKNKDADHTAKLIRAYVFATRIVQFLLYIRRFSGKFVDTNNIFNRKRNGVKMNKSGFAKIFQEQIDEIL